MNKTLKKFKEAIAPRNTYIKDYKKSRNFFWMLFAVYTVVYVTKQCFSAALASIVAEGVLTKSQTGLISGAFYFFYGPLQVVGGVWADKYNSELLVKVGIIGGAIANLIIFLNHNFYVMLIVWLLNGVIQFPLWTAVFKMITSGIAPEYRQKSVFYISFTATIALAMAFVIGALVPAWEYNFAISFLMLVVCVVIFHFSCRKADKYSVPITNIIPQNQGERAEHIIHTGISSIRLFAVSGFFMLIPVTVFRNMVENGIKSISPAMLTEVYPNINPSFGNLLNVLIILSGFVGILLFKKLLYPKHIKNEVTAHMLSMLLPLPFMAVLLFIGGVSSGFTVLSLCAASLLLSPTSMIVNLCCMRFAKFGKNGTAAGIVNTAASYAIMFMNYLFLKLADDFGWKAVTVMWFAMTAVSVILLLIVMRRWNRFEGMRLFKD